MHGGDSLFGRMTSTTHVYRDSGIVDSELDHKTHKVTEKLSESINTIANEPSVAFYRIQEHVRKTLPQLVELKHEVEEVQQLVQGACFDTEYAGNAVKGMQKSVVHFQNIQELLKNAMFMKQQIDYDEVRKRQSRAVGGSGRQEGPSGNKAEEGSDNMEDSAVSTDSSLVASGHTNTEDDAEKESGEHMEREDREQEKDPAERQVIQEQTQTSDREDTEQGKDAQERQTTQELTETEEAKQGKDAAQTQATRIQTDSSESKDTLEETDKRESKDRQEKDAEDKEGTDREEDRQEGKEDTTENDQRRDKENPVDESPSSTDTAES